MEDFGTTLLKFDCTYQQNNEVKDFYKWSGYIHKYQDIPNKDKRFLLEGVIRDQVDPKHERYLYTPNGYIISKGIVNLSIFTWWITRPIDYKFKYDDEDRCLYGCWKFVNSDYNLPINYGYAKLNIESARDEENPWAFEDTLEKIETEIDDCLSKYYHRFEKELKMMKKHDFSNVADDNILSDRQFQKAKEYFKNLK